MEDILKRALGEALTAKYADELNSAYDTEYVFSDEFEYRMKKLVMETDHPIRKYTKYIAAAACACIAVGCAVLIPALTTNKVTVSDISESTAAAEETHAETEAEAPAHTFATTVPAAVEEVSAEEEEAEGEIAAADVTTTGAAANGADIEEDEAAEPIKDADDGEDDVVLESEDEISDEGDDAFPEEEYYDDCEDDEDFGDEDFVGDDAFAVEEEEDCDESCEEDVGMDDCDVADEDYAEDDPTIIIEQTFGTLDGYIAYAGEQNSFGETPSVKNMRVQDAVLFDSLLCKNIQRLNTIYHDYGFLNEFRNVMAEAVSDDSLLIDDDCCITLNLSTNGTKAAPFYYNLSPWLRYDSYFTEEGYEEDDVDYDDYIGEDVLHLKVNIYECGLIYVKEIDVFSADDYDGSVSLVKYGLNTRFRADEKAVKALFERFEKMRLPENAKTFGDVISGMNITADNITESDAEIIKLYDTIARFPVSAETAAEFAAGCASARRIDEISAELRNDNNGYGTLKFCLMDTDASIEIEFGTKYITISSERSSMYFEYDSTESAVKLLKAAAEENGFTLPNYKNFSEYIEGKHFDKARGASCSNYELYDDEALENIRQIILKAAKKSKYIPSYKQSYTISRIYIGMEHYSTTVTLYSDDVIAILSNSFKLPDGTYNKIMDIIKDKGHYYEEEEDEVDEEIFNDEDDEVDEEDYADDAEDVEIIEVFDE